MNWDYCTHVPMLYEATRMTSGLVVELGVGLCSTPLLSSLVTFGVSPRELVSVDHDENWLNVIRSRFKMNEQHHFVHVVDWERDLQQLVASRPSLVFIDNGSTEDILGAEDLRWRMIRLFKDSAQVLVIHDSSNILFRNVSQERKSLLRSFSIVVDDRHETPSTLWLSNSIAPEMAFSKR